MRKLVEAVLLVSILLSLFGCFANAAERPIIICASQVSNFIDQTQLKDRFSADAKLLASSNYKARWSDAIAGIGKASDEHGSIRDVKMFAVPFANDGGEIKAAIIGGIFRSEGGPQIYEFITSVSIPAGGINSADIIRPEIESKAAISDLDIKPLLRSIAIGNRSEIWDYILRSIDIKAPDSGSTIRAAFESSGYACSIAPAWFPQKSIWYAATCINRIH